MIDNFMRLLKNSPKKNVFNPWYQIDTYNDISKNSYKIRYNQLKTYLEERLNTAQYLLIAEAIGYQGGHFSGIAMTSERILNGGLIQKGIRPNQVFTNIKPQRTSKNEVKKNGFTEPTATILWSALNEMNIDTKKVINWNAFPWHPYNEKKGILSNRTPTNKELETGVPILLEMMKIFKIKKIIAIGEKSYGILSQINIESEKVRHPANGGAGKFREQIKSIMS